MKSSKARIAKIADTREIRCDNNFQQAVIIGLIAVAVLVLFILPIPFFSIIMLYVCIKEYQEIAGSLLVLALSIFYCVTFYMKIGLI